MAVDPRLIAADLREAGRYCRSHPDEAVAQAERILAALADPGWPRDGHGRRVADRLANNLGAGIRLVRCAPDVLRGYLIGAATEIEGLVGREGGRDG